VISRMPRPRAQTEPSWQLRSELLEPPASPKPAPAPEPLDPTVLVLPPICSEAQLQKTKKAIELRRAKTSPTSPSDGLLSSSAPAGPPPVLMHDDSPTQEMEKLDLCVTAEDDDGCLFLMEDELEGPAHDDETVPDDTHDVQGSMQASPVRKYSDLSVHFETMPSLSLDGVRSRNNTGDSTISEVASPLNKGVAFCGSPMLISCLQQVQKATTGERTMRATAGRGQLPGEHRFSVESAS